jgi:hypothetical protein
MWEANNRGLPRTLRDILDADSFLCKRCAARSGAAYLAGHITFLVLVEFSVWRRNRVLKRLASDRSTNRPVVCHDRAVLSSKH